MTRVRRWWPLALLLLGGALTGFVLVQAPGQAFVDDDRIVVLRPQGLHPVPFPVTIDWSVRDDIADRVRDREMFFAVFVDRPPIARGETLAALADDACRREPDCPDRTWLAERRVFVTLDTTVEIAALVDSGMAGRGGSVSVHQATIVLLNAAGQRVDEHATVVRFRTERRQ